MTYTKKRQNPCQSKGFDVDCQQESPDGSEDSEWRRRESNPRAESRNSEVAKRLWHMLQDVGVSWEWKDDANWQSVATEQEELAAVITAWPLLLADLRQAVLAIVRSADVMAEASCAATE